MLNPEHSGIVEFEIMLRKNLKFMVFDLFLVMHWCASPFNVEVERFASFTGIAEFEVHENFEFECRVVCCHSFLVY